MNLMLPQAAQQGGHFIFKPAVVNPLLADTARVERSTLKIFFIRLDPGLFISKKIRPTRKHLQKVNG